MRPYSRRLVLLATTVAALALTGCTGGGHAKPAAFSNVPSVNASTSASVSPSSSSGSASNTNSYNPNVSVGTSGSSGVSPNPSGTNTETPVPMSGTACQVEVGDVSVVTPTDYCSKIPAVRTDCLETPNSAQLPNSTVNGQVIKHPDWTCHGVFTESVDFTYLGDTVQCNSSSRPCREPLRALPNYQDPAYPDSAWAPVEGRDVVNVSCQAVGQNALLSGGYLRDVRGSSPSWYSAIWDKVSNPSLPNGFGYINDIWLGNKGWRGIPCAAS